MGAGLAGRPLRVGILGLGRIGQFHQERLGLRDDMQVVAICDEDPDRLREAPRCDGARYGNIAAFLADDAVDLVFVAAPLTTRRRLTRDALAAGRHVALEPPLCGSVRGAERLLALARRRGRLLATLDRGGSGDDFRAALAQAQSGALGRVVGARWSLHGRGEAALLERVAGQFEQLRRLMDDVPRTVYGAARRGGDGKTVAACTIVVTYAAGGVAVLDLDLASLAVSGSGWELTGIEAAYRRFERYSTTADGEVFGVAAHPPQAGMDRHYDEIVALVRESDTGAWQQAGEAARRTVVLLDAARRSLRLGQVVRVEGW